MTTPPPSGSVLAVHTLDEAAAFLRVRKSWLERQAAARRIPFTMLGGAYHFTSDHLLTIVQIHEVTARGQDEATSRPQRPRRHPESPAHAVAPLRPRPRTGPRRAA